MNKTFWQEFEEAVIQEIKADVLKCRQYCQACGAETSHIVEPDGEDWERFTCETCGNSHAVRTQ